MPAIPPEKSPPPGCSLNLVADTHCGSERLAIPTDEVNSDQNRANTQSLTVTFLGCPSSSTRIRLPTPKIQAEPRSSECYEHTEKSPSKLVPHCENQHAVFTARKVCTIEAWKQSEGKNNNKSSEPDQVDCTDEDNNSETEHGSGFTADRGDECHNDTEENEEDEDTGDNSSTLNTQSDESQDNPDRKNQDSSETNADDGQDQTESSSWCIEKTGSVSRVREANSESNPAPVDSVAAPHSPQKKKSTGSLGGCGRAILSRMQRSPQRNASPSRKKSGQSKASSAPAPVMPTPVQSSSGFTNIFRATAASPTRGSETMALFGKVGLGSHSAEHDSLAKPVLQKFSREVSDSDEIPSVCVRPAASPSPAAPNLHQPAVPPHPAPPHPAPSPAEADLRQPLSGPNQFQAAVQKVPCQLILPEESWSSPRAPHGDTQQAEPHKVLEMSRLALLDQEQDKKKPQFVKSQGHILLGQMSLTPDSKAAMKMEASQKETASCPRGAKAVTSATRSSRRHPVLDKMFRHVLASLVQESGPPSSACLASVLEHAGSQGGWSGHSRPSCTTSRSSTLTSRFSRTRATSGGEGGAGVLRSNSADVTYSFSNSLPCTLAKVNEEVSCTNRE